MSAPIARVASSEEFFRVESTSELDFETDFVYTADKYQSARMEYDVSGEGTFFITHVYRRRGGGVGDVGVEWKLERELVGMSYISHLYARALGESTWEERFPDPPLGTSENITVGLRSKVNPGYPPGATGTFDVLDEVYLDGDTPPGLSQALEYDVRCLVLELTATPPIFNPNCPEQNHTTLVGVFKTLPIPGASEIPEYSGGWSLLSDIDWEMTVSIERSLAAQRTYSGTATASGPDSEGVVGSFSEEWNGRDDNDDPVEALMRAAASGSADAPQEMGSTPGPVSIDSNQPRIPVVCCTCVPCEVGTSGYFKKAFHFSLTDTPVGPALVATMAVNSMNSQFTPASMGYGWSGSGSIRVVELDNDDLCYQDETGSYLRWTLDGGNYVPYWPGNYVEAVKEVSNPNYTYALTFPDQSRREFDEEGRILREVDRNGNELTYDYSGGQLVSITDATETRALYFDYGTRTDGQPVSIRANDPSTGRQIQLEYYSDSDPDSPDRLRKIIDPEGETTEFIYDPVTGCISQILDARGEAARTFSYDALQRVRTEQIYDQVLRTYWYDQAPYTPSVPSMERWEEDLTEREPLRATLYNYNRLFSVTHLYELVDAGEDIEDGCDNAPPRVWRFFYEDEFNPYLLTRRMDPNGNSTYMTYNEQGNLILLKDAQENETAYEYADDIDDPLNPMHRNLVRKIYRPEVTVGGVPTPYNPTEFQYDANGNLEKVIDAKAKEIIFSVRPDGLIETITDRRSKVTEFTYHANGNLATVTSPEERTLTFDYDDYDNLDEVTDDLSQTVTSVYDANDRVTQMTDARGKYVTMNYVDGLLDSLEAPTNQGSGANRRSINYTYDDAARLIQVDADIDVSTQEMRVRYEYTGFSSLHRLLRLMNATEKTAASYSYDALGRMVSAKDALDRETAISHAPFCVEHAVTTPRGITRTHSFDNLCRMTEVVANREFRAFEYDELGRLVSAANGTRYQLGVVGENAYLGVERYQYDELDRLVGITYANEETAAFDYDEEGNVVQVTDPHGKVTAYCYYDDNRLHQVKIQRLGDPDRVFTYVYDEVGRLDEIQYPEETGIVLRFYETVEEEKVRGWDENGQLLFMQYLKDDEHLQSFRYAYDDSGNRIQMVDTPENPANEVVWDYSYDWLNRLVGVSRDSVPTTAYAYDESDNRIEANLLLLDELHTFAYDDADQLESHSITVDPDPPAIFETFEHDDDGNMISRTSGGVVTEYRWTDFDQMARRVVDEEYQEGHAYDAGNQRRFRTGKTRYFDSLAELRPTCEVSFFQGHQLLGMEHDGDRFYYLTDGLASVRLVVDSDGEVVASFAHDEWGVQESATGSSDLATHSYVGALNVRNENAASGLLLMGHRWYDALLGRFLTRDPIGFAGGLNLYGYVDGNPINNSDPNGLEGPPPGWRWGAKGIEPVPPHPDSTDAAHKWGDNKSRIEVYRQGQRRISVGLKYWGGARLENNGLNCGGHTAYGQGFNPTQRMIPCETGSYKKRMYPRLVRGLMPKVGDVAFFDGHVGTVVDVQGKKVTIFGQDGRYGMYSGTQEQWSKLNYGAFEGYYSAPAGPNPTVDQYRALSQQYPDQNYPKGVPFPDASAIPRR